MNNTNRPIFVENESERFPRTVFEFQKRLNCFTKAWTKNVHISAYSKETAWLIILKN